MRCFIAIGMPHETENRLRSLIEQLKPLSHAVKWVAPENLHLTLKFLGETHEDKVPEIIGALRDVTAGHKPFTLTAHGTGVFPNANWPKVVWVGLDSEGGLLALHSDIEKAMEPLGFAPEKRAFSPHLTIGRIKVGRDKPLQLEHLMHEITTRKEEDFGSFEVSEVALVKSDLRPAGAVHTTVFGSPLG